MNVTQPTHFIRTDIWREGKWIDLWSVVHLLSGMSVGLGFSLLHFAGLPASLLALVSFTAYEMWEKLMGIEETPANRFMDVVVGMMGFMPVLYLLAPTLAETRVPAVFAMVLAVNIVMSALGWHASHKAAVLAERFRATYEKEREVLSKRGKQLTQKYHREPKS